MSDIFVISENSILNVFSCGHEIVDEAGVSDDVGNAFHDLPELSHRVGVELLCGMNGEERSGHEIQGGDKGSPADVHHPPAIATPLHVAAAGHATRSWRP